jgi:polyhydroxyalkanoate synthase
MQVTAIVPNRKVHAAGYCIGGTLLSIAAAAMARDGDKRLQSLSFFAAQTDFSEAGELTLFINESQLAFLDDVMWEQGFSTAGRWRARFSSCARTISSGHAWCAPYLMGEREPMIDLNAWNADATRMAYRQHSEYLRRLFLDNDLAEGRFPAGGKPVALMDLHAPIFAVGTETDHVAPWRSAYKIHLLTDAEVTFVLTSGGHNVGIVPSQGTRIGTTASLPKRQDDPYVDPDGWMAAAPAKTDRGGRSGSRGSMHARVNRIAAGNGAPGYAPLCDAPGTYVLQE